MSRAFVKETDRDDDLPERSHSELPNYISSQGLQNLQQQAEKLVAEISKLRTSETLEDKNRLAPLQRDLRYWQERIRRAIPVAPQAHYKKVAFGCLVLLEDEQENALTFAIAGEDEADVKAGIISWASPLAKAMIGKQVGDTVVWPRNDNPIELTIVAIHPFPE